jgi:hypothetical protein
VSREAKKGCVPALRFPEFLDALYNPHPTSPLSGGGALHPFGLTLPGGGMLSWFPPLVRGGLGWGCSGDQP